MRSILTVLGITIGIAAVICVVAIGNAGQARVQQQLNNLGDNFVWIEAGGHVSIRLRLTIWYAGLLAGALVLFEFFVYVGLEQYLVRNATATLEEQSRSIGTELLTQLSSKGRAWLGRVFCQLDLQYLPIWPL